MQKKLSVIALPMLLTGCQIFDNSGLLARQESADTEQLQNSSMTSTYNDSVSFKREYADKFIAFNLPSNQTNPENLNINTYIAGIAQKLIGNLQYVNTHTPVVITSFVYLDSDYIHADILGNQLAEGLINEIHKFGIPVIDIKTTDFIRVTEVGDFVFSKDYTELTADLPIKYVVGGTIVKHNDGFLVNARIVGLNSKAVVASAQSFIPQMVANNLQKSTNTDAGKIKLVKK